MKLRPKAIGYVRSDISGIAQDWHETRMRSVAARLGYDYKKTIVVNGKRDPRPLAPLKATTIREQAEAVVVPSIAHLGGEVPVDLAQITDIITVEPEDTYARWATGGVHAGKESTR